jgi:lipopolysaccharide exporter
MTNTETRTLSQSVRRGALLSIASALFLRLTNILITAIVARILDPRDFGVYAVALTSYAIVTAIGRLGVASCLIRADLDIDSLAPTMVTVSLIGCAVLAGVMAACAKPIAVALGSAYATGPVRVMALAVLLSGVFAVPGAQLVREFKQGKLLLANVISFFPSNAALLLLARSGSGAMAFAWSRLIGEFVVGSVLVASAPKIYRPGFTRDALSVLFRFGLPFAAANFINFILLNVDNALIGNLMGAVKLGIYVLAFNTASWPYTLLGAMINTVAMPAFSRVKHDAKLLQDAITTAVRDLSLVVLPICGVMIALARPLILTLYGAKWAASAQVLTVLAVYSGISMMCVLFSSILGSMGRTKSLLIIQLVWLCALAPAMALGVHWNGIVGAAVAHIAIIGPIVLPCYLFAMKKTTGVGPGSLGKAAFPALLSSFIAALAVRATALQFSNSFIQLITGLSVGGLFYIVAVAPHAIRLLNRGKDIGSRMRRIIRMHNIAAQTVGLPNDTPPKHAARGRAKYVGKRSGTASAQRKLPGPAASYHPLNSGYRTFNDYHSGSRNASNGDGLPNGLDAELRQAAIYPHDPNNLRGPKAVNKPIGHRSPDMPNAAPSRSTRLAGNRAPDLRSPGGYSGLDQPANPGLQRQAADWSAWHHNGPGPATVKPGARAEPTGFYPADVRPYGRMVVFILLDGKVTEFDRLARHTAMEIGSREPGTLVYAIHLVPNAPLQRIFYEIYRDRAAFEIHESQPHMKRFVAEWRSCVFATNVIELGLVARRNFPSGLPQILLCGVRHNEAIRGGRRTADPGVHPHGDREARAARRIAPSTAAE